LQALTGGLLAAAGGMQEPPPVDEDTILVPMLDARRMEVYSAFFNHRLEFIREVQAEVIGESTYSGWLDDRKMVFFGTGAAKTREVIVHPHAYFVDGIEPSAQHMAGLSETSYREGRFEDVAYFEPFYLKDFIATKPRKNIIPRRKSRE
jgi:tRNA threonylcarbamoyladenosine biosynthesis protein TsaB